MPNLVSPRNSFANEGVKKQSVRDSFDSEFDGSLAEDEYVPNLVGLTTGEATKRREEFGLNELPDEPTPIWRIVLGLLTQPMALMIWLAAIVEFIISNYPDMCILLGIIFINAGISFYETQKAGSAVAALKSSLRPTATAKRDGAWANIPGNMLVPGDLVLLAAGSAIPADCILNHGDIEVDQSCLTGESMPVSMYAVDQSQRPKMGSTVMRGEVEATVIHTGANTVLGQTAALLTGKEETSNLQKILMRIIVILMILSLTLSGIAFYYIMDQGGITVHEALSFTVVMVVASMPIAIEIVCTTTLALGSKELTRHGAIVTRLSSIEDLAGMNILCSDKTGTLTMNKMELQQESPTYQPGVTLEKTLMYAAMAAKWNEPPRDALDTLVLTSVNRTLLEGVEQLDYTPFDPVKKRTEGRVKLPNGKEFCITKGAPNIILNLCRDEEICAKANREMLELGARGIRSLAVAKTNDEGTWELQALLTFLDPPRPDSKRTINEAKFLGVPVKMITGDHLLIAKETSRVLGLGTNVLGPDSLPLLNEDGSHPADLVETYGEVIESADGFAQVFPQHKFLAVQCLRDMGYKVGMTGDGVNDAPALKNADVGIAVSGSTDAARAAADIVLTDPGLHTIITGIKLARDIFQRMLNFNTYRIAASLQLLIFFFVAVLAFRPIDFHHEKSDDETWPKFYKMPVLMLMLITLLNDGTLISIGYDNVVAPKRPGRWNLRVLFTVSTVLGAVACLSSLGLLLVALDSWNDDGLFRMLGLPGLNFGQITTMMYLKVSLSDFLTLFSARSGEGFFFNSKPAPILLFAAAFSMCLSTLLAAFWPKSTLDGVAVLGLSRHDPKLLPLYVWVYCLLVWIIQDVVKVLTYKFLRYFNLFGVVDDHTTGFAATMDSIKSSKRGYSPGMLSRPHTPLNGLHSPLLVAVADPV